MDLDGFCAELTSRVEGQHQDVDDDVQPPTPRENFVGPSLSFNMTEFVRGLEDDSVDEQHEVESAPGVGYDDVHGHKVKIELAGLVGAIFGRYGDITAECNAKSPPFLSFFLERLCVFYQTLEESKLSELTREQINGMLDELHLFETHKLNVKWLLERLELISETKSKKYLAVKEEAEKHIKYNSIIDEDLKQRRKHIDLLQMNISALEREKEENEATLSALEKKRVENQAKADECTQMAIDMKTRGQALANQSLVHSLL